ncbi:MAG: DUF4215 domain-containing protein [Deltaproteobacteria bacterium]|nr:DUF4215 domain-containing protein [Deltaproteobacteria bacterium]
MTSSLRSPRLALSGALLLLALATTGCPKNGDDPVCGNSITEGSETCDDGNTTDGDGCSALCQTESTSPVCGDGVLGAGEECDDGNTTAGDGCSDTCTSEVVPGCGNGILEAGEDCDDGNTTSGDGCSDLCAVEIPPGCGNGTLDPGEECDEGAQNGSGNCQANCTLAEVVVCQTLTPLASGVCEVTAGNASRLIVGNVLGKNTLFRGGEVLVDGSGAITCVGCDCAAQAAGATVVTCPEGVVSPGLINAHDHITYVNNWPYTDSGERYEHRHDWRKGTNQHTPIPYDSGATSNQVRWGELRFFMGGATAVNGSGSASGFMRNLDRAAQEGLGQPEVYYQTFPLGDGSGTQLDLADGCGYSYRDTNSSIQGNDAYTPHISEGIDEYSLNEFVCTQSNDPGEDLLEPFSAYIHGIGLTPFEYSQMALEGTGLIWSPRSNITLYGDTAQVAVASRLGVTVALGTDWIPTGSMNLQRELQCADSWNRDRLDGHFTDRQLWLMATRNAAELLAVDDAIGSLAPGLVADLAIFDGSAHPDYRAVIDAQPQDVVLVMRGGEVLYGDDALVSTLGPGGCDTLDVCGTGKRVCATADTGSSLAQLQADNNGQYPLFYCGAPQNEPSCHPVRPAAVNGSTVYTGELTAADPDGDGIPDASDNCPNAFNPVRPVDNGAQRDHDGDGLGDACDPCPLDADTLNCSTPDPADIDGDGVPTVSDNCPNIRNADQLDGDNDGRGDVCDACPADSNPAPRACPVSVYDVKQGVATGVVALRNMLVTACSSSRGYYVQMKDGDPGYLGSDYSGIFVYSPDVSCGTTVSEGDRVDLDPATVEDWWGQIELTYATVTVLSSGEALPAPVVVTPAEAGGTLPTPLESVLVRVQGVSVTEVEPAPGPGDASPNNEFVVDGQLRVNDYIYLTTPLPTVGETYSSITGVLDYRNGNSKLEPRRAADLSSGPPVLRPFDGATRFLREGVTASPTIPAALEVVLSAPALTDTFVTLTSGDPTAVGVVGGGVTVPTGSTRAVVLLDGLQQAAAVTLTATLDTATFITDVRVVGATEVPQVIEVRPAGASVPLGGTVDLEVVLDLPASPTTGESVVLSSAPGTSGNVPATVVVAPDTLTATFTFTATTTEGAETVTATLGASSASTDVYVVASVGGLVVNEVDYDQVGTDSLEFVELLNGSSAPRDLTGLALVLVNGSGNAEYDRVVLDGITLASGEYLVIGSSALLATVPGGVQTLAFGAATNNIQNGGPDALGILDVAAGTLVDAISYEGLVTAGIVSGVTGTLDFVEGTSATATDNNSTEASICRLPNGTDTDDAEADWAVCATPTPGAANLQ